MTENPGRRVRELRTARAAMIATRERIDARVKGLTSEELLRRPADGGWSAAEVLDHIGIGEAKLVKGLTKIVNGEPVRGMPRRCWYYRLPMSLAFSDIKFKAPRPVTPRPPAEIDPQAVIQGLSASRKAFLELADRLGEERFLRVVFPHFIIGRFDGLDWFRFIGRHEARHAAQLERVLDETLKA